MTTEFRLPDVGEGLEEAEILRWLVTEGDEVDLDQPLCDILTDKSETQLPAPTAGRVTRLAVAEGDRPHVGDLLVVIEETGSEPATSPPAAPSAPTVGPSGGGAETGARGSKRPRVKAAPSVRRRARELGIDLSTVTGSGPGGRITAADLDAAATRPAAPATSPTPPPPSSQAPTPPPAPTGIPGQMPVGVHPLRGIRRVTAAHMEEAWRIPHIHGSDEIDASELLATRREIKRLHPEAADLTPMAFFIMAVARALVRHPQANASIDTGAETITVHPEVNIGMAVATEAGLVVPVVRNADRLDLFALAREVRRLVTAARDRTVTAAELSGGTATITNYGSLGGRYSTPIIRAPEALIVGFGAIRPRPFVVRGEVAARPTLPIVTGGDHRLIDGDLLTAIQEYVADQLTHPGLLAVSAPGTPW
ncbi:MAG TPA: 2-oxo acid dehydrogenase subunit E2 [Acidimicrobiales bacterium]|nr:2-oxo acid dehydrogenase subunit E2 [Acidimicrobiales bacterium]